MARERTLRTAAVVIGLVLLAGAGIGARQCLFDPDTPAPAEIGPNPFAIVLDANTGSLFVVSRGLVRANEAGAPGIISMVDAFGGRVRRTEDVGIHPVALAIDARRGRVFVVNRGTFSDGAPDGPGSVSTVDAKTGNVISTTRVGLAPVAVAVDEGIGRVVVVNQGRSGVSGTLYPGSLSVLSSDTGEVIAEVTAGTYSGAVALDRTRHVAFVTNLVSNSITIVDLATARSTGTVLLGDEPGRVVAVGVNDSGGGVFALSLPPTTSGQQASPMGQLQVVDVGNETVSATLPIRDPIALEVDGVSGRAFVLSRMDRGALLSAIDGPTGSIAWTTTTAMESTGMALAPGLGELLLVDHDGSGVGIVRTDTGELACLVGMAGHPVALAVDAAGSRVFVLTDQPAGVTPISLPCPR